MFNKSSLPKQSLKWIKDLKKILDKAIISPRLKVAVSETIKALEEKDWDLAYQITAVKSYICGVVNPKDKTHAFQEDHAANEKALTASVYMILDIMHHDIAFALDEMPSGMMALSRSGVRSMSWTMAKGTHPIVRRIKWEHKAIQKMAK